MSTLLYRLGGAAAAHPWRTIAAWLAALAVAVGLSMAVGGQPHDDYRVAGSPAQAGADFLDSHFGNTFGADARIVVHTATGSPDAGELEALQDRLQGLPHVTAVDPPRLSADGDTALIGVHYDVPVTEFEGSEAVDALWSAAAPIKQTGAQVALGGQVPENFAPPSGVAELVGVLIALVILVFAFGSVLAAGLPLAVAFVGLGIGSSLIAVLAAVSDVSTTAPTVASMVGIGVGIDYALLLVTRHLEGLRAGLPVPEAAARANGTAGVSVVFAGSTVLVSLLGLRLADLQVYSSVGLATLLVVAVVMLTSITLVPALCGLAGNRLLRRAERAGVGGGAQGTGEHDVAGDRVGEYRQGHAVGGDSGTGRHAHGTGEHDVAGDRVGEYRQGHAVGGDSGTGRHAHGTGEHDVADDRVGEYRQGHAVGGDSGTGRHAHGTSEHDVAGDRVGEYRHNRAVSHVSEVERGSAAWSEASPEPTRPASRLEQTFTARWAERIGRRPWPWAVAALTLLLLLAAPVLGMRTWPQDAGSKPESNTTRIAYDLVEAEYGPGANGPLLLAVDLSRQPATGLAALVDRLSADPGVALVTPPTVNPAGDAALIIVQPTTGPQDEQTTVLLERLRAELPESVQITGLTATFADISERLADRLWVVIAFVVGVSLLLMTAVFRSVVVAVKAAVMNLLSVAAAYGVMVAVFQWGWGAKLLGLPHAVPVSSWVPILMFTILFGLSMDYQVFLLSRVREDYLATGDPRRSVIRGLASTGRVITCAAAIMIAVFIGFGLDADPTVKMMGVGMAVAVLIDATIVRMVLVPATMSLLGRANWWLPGWLDRLLPHLDVDGRIPDGATSDDATPDIATPGSQAGLAESRSAASSPAGLAESARRSGTSAGLAENVLGSEGPAGLAESAAADRAPEPAGR